MDHKTFIETLAGRLNIPREDVGILTDAFGAVVEEAAAQGDSVAVPGFGNFEVRKRDERISVHPSTGRRMLYPPKLTLVFRPSSLLRRQVREND